MSSQWRKSIIDYYFNIAKRYGWTYIEVQNLIGDFIKRTQESGRDPQAMEALLDELDWKGRGVGGERYEILKSDLIALMGRTEKEWLEEAEALALSELDRMAAELGLSVVEPERLEKVQLYQETLEKLREERKKRRLTEKELDEAKANLDRLREELKKPKPPKEEDYIPFVEKGLSKADEQELRTEFEAELLKRQVVTPRKWLPIFEDELNKWKKELAEFNRADAFKEAKSDLMTKVIPDVLERAKPPPIVPPPKERLPAYPEEVFPPVPTRVEVAEERKPQIETRECWRCGEEFQIDRDLEKIVRQELQEIRGPRSVAIHGALLDFPRLFYYLCEKDREERFGYKDIYDALAFRIFESQSKGSFKLTFEDLEERGLNKDDIAQIRARLTRWIPK